MEMTVCMKTLSVVNCVPKSDLFLKDAMERSIREIASMGHFDPEEV